MLCPVGIGEFIVIQPNAPLRTQDNPLLRLDGDGVVLETAAALPLRLGFDLQCQMDPLLAIDRLSPEGDGCLESDFQTIMPDWGDLHLPGEREDSPWGPFQLLNLQTHQDHPL